ncbi:MAG: GNAT family N-acetyltransferase [Chitinophagaceae bacterium]|jgi:RimJ/RimL family protein N-acetyltransferase|nr:GNAT family N-acetyltransferase [Chitinophagaceae bacterium]
MPAFDHTEIYSLEDDRVRLRPLEESDLINLLPFAMQEPELWNYSLTSAAGEEGLHDYIRQALGARWSGKEYPFIVFDKKANAYAGSTRFYDIQPYHASLQLGYTWYGKDFQRTGLNRHCKFLLLDFAFGQLDMERVEFRADARNERSIAAMKAIGCTVEGILRSNQLRSDGKRRDSIVLSILKTEWLSGIRDGFKRLQY